MFGIADHTHMIHLYEREFGNESSRESATVYWLPNDEIFGLFVHVGARIYEGQMSREERKIFLRNPPDDILEPKWLYVTS